MTEESEIERCCAYCAEHRDYDTCCTLRAAMIALHQIDSTAMCCPLFKKMKVRLEVDK